MLLEGGRVSQRVSTSGNRLGGTFWGRGGMPPVSEKNNSTLGGMCCMWDKVCLAGFESHPQNCKSGLSGETQDTFESCRPPPLTNSQELKKYNICSTRLRITPHFTTPQPCTSPISLSSKRNRSSNVPKPIVLQHRQLGLGHNRCKL